MGTAIVGVAGALLGVLTGGLLQHALAARTRRWQREDALGKLKQAVYAEYLRAISASYGQAVAGERTRTEDARLHAATAEIEVLAGAAVSGPARELTTAVIDVHTKIAEGGVEEASVTAVDIRRLKLIALFKSDLGIEP
ncbi:hypothetical protein [Amycolatopsis australiensis]|uniref:Uncharacterized protein n=1 Tax=Amycolatopsis australiensis TaxID=546364 RepID=A0A1K1SV04_9PSEU|nr:hypothetical protein [Amycolatopsis australiensis]SFW88068.1 hypothetical protein SAMN04489730_6862 [Amycolatopsis australiensis]